MKQIKRSCDSGVVMMETILVLPIYLVILSGLFYLGEMCLIRLGLTNGERLRLWEHSSQHTISQVASRNVFWNMESINNADVVAGVSDIGFSQVNGSNIGWGQIISGNSTLNVRRSDWSHDVETSILSLWRKGGNSSNQTMNVVAGGTVDQPLINSLLSRQSYAGRSAIYSSLKQNDGNIWEQEYLPPWFMVKNGTTYTITPDSKGTSYSIRPYNGGVRNANYVRWSE